MKAYLSNRFNSLKYAFQGMRFCAAGPNFQIALVCATLAIASGLLLKISYTEWCAVIMCIGGVLALEAINTAIEETVNLISSERNGKAGMIKDLAAGAVLIFSLAAAAIGLIIFLPRLIRFIN